MLRMTHRSLLYACFASMTLASCSGGSATLTPSASPRPTLGPASPPPSAAPLAIASIPSGSAATTVSTATTSSTITLPSVAGITTTLELPAASQAVTMNVEIETGDSAARNGQGAAGVARTLAHRLGAAALTTNDLQAYDLVLTSPIDVTLATMPGFSVDFGALLPVFGGKLDELGFSTTYDGQFYIDSNFITGTLAGPFTISGTKATYAGPVGSPVTIKANVPFYIGLSFFTPTPPAVTAPTPPPPTTATASGKMLYLSSVGTAGTSDEIVAFPVDASGNVAPTIRIAGDRTQLLGPDDLAIDANGYIYVANYGSAATQLGSIVVFAPGSNGNVAPVRTISDPSLQLLHGIALGPDGTIYAADTDSIKTFAAGTSPMASSVPVRTIANVFATDVKFLQAPQFGAVLATAGTPGIGFYDPLASGQAKPLFTFQDGAVSLVSDGVQAIYVLDARLGPTQVATGIAQYTSASFAVDPPVPAHTLVGYHTGIAVGTKMGTDAGNVYLSEFQSRSILVYGADAFGGPFGSTADVAPTRTIGGAATTIGLPFGIAIH